MTMCAESGAKSMDRGSVTSDGDGLYLVDSGLVETMGGIGTQHHLCNILRILAQTLQCATMSHVAGFIG